LGTIFFKSGATFWAIFSQTHLVTQKGLAIFCLLRFCRLYKSSYPAFCVLSHLVLASLMLFLILASCFARDLWRKLASISAAIALLDTFWILSKPI
jgi:hypothetical protein